MRARGLVPSSGILPFFLIVALSTTLLASSPESPSVSVRRDGPSDAPVRVIWVLPAADPASPDGQAPWLSIDDRVITHRGDGKRIELDGSEVAWVWDVSRVALTDLSPEAPHRLSATFADSDPDGLGTMIPAGDVPSEICVGCRPGDATQVEKSLRPESVPFQNSERVFPNPFNPIRADTRVQWVLAEPAEVTISVYDWNGEFVATVFRGSGTVGVNEAFWGGQTEDGRSLGNGVYFIRIVSDNGIRQESAVLKVVIWNED